MNELLELLEENGVEVSDELKGEIKNIYPEEVNTDGLFTQEELSEKIKSKLAREQKLHEQEINDLKGEMKDLVDPSKVEEYEETIEELEGKADKRANGLKKDYELKLAASKAGIEDEEYFEFLVNKKGLKERIKVDDGIYVTDDKGNVITNEDGEKFGVSKLVDEIVEEKPDLVGDGDGKKKKKRKSSGPTNPPDGSGDEVKKKNTKNMIEELGFKK